jgi:hypothetical protein
MKKEDAKLAVIREWDVWASKHISGRQPTAADALMFFGYLGRGRTDLLNFRSDGDKWQVVHGWLTNERRVPWMSVAPAMPNGRCRMHGGPSPGAPKGNRNAYKHGLYTAEAIARRRGIALLVRTARQLAVG